MSQLDLFAPASNSTTSLDAAEKIQPDAATLRAQVLRFIQSQGSHGATDEEIQSALNMQGNTERPRRRELAKAGQIVDSGKTRPTASGRSAIVWRTPTGATT